MKSVVHTRGGPFLRKVVLICPSLNLHKYEKKIRSPMVRKLYVSTKVSKSSKWATILYSLIKKSISLKNETDQNSLKLV